MPALHSDTQGASQRRLRPAAVATSVAAQAGLELAHWKALAAVNSSSPLRLKASVVICISPEMAPAICREMVQVLQPSLLIMWVHRADTATATSKILQIHPRYQLVALAPHVARLCHTRMKQDVSWTLPIAPYQPAVAMDGAHNGPGDDSHSLFLACERRACLDGFAVQGALRKYKSKAASGFTRNYTALWERLAQLKAAVAEPRNGGVRVVVLGKGLRSELGIPPTLDADVQHFSSLAYPEFWARIHRSLALVPAFGMPVYYESRISSTIIASLITGTPLLAEQLMLDTYTFLTPAHVFLRQPGEDEAAAMYRVASMPEADVLSRRASMRQLRESLNDRSRDMLSTWIKDAQQRS